MKWLVSGSSWIMECECEGQEKLPSQNRNTEIYYAWTRRINASASRTKNFRDETDASLDVVHNHTFSVLWCLDRSPHIHVEIYTNSHLIHMLSHVEFCDDCYSNKPFFLLG